jgi:glyoxylase-like metal-dependent hydrolase (beta-lactamase superfamily II)
MALLSNTPIVLQEALAKTGVGGPTIHRESVQPILDAGLATAVTAHHVVLEEGGVEGDKEGGHWGGVCHTRIYLRPTPGHTVGHVSVVLESDGETAVITGDCIHHPVQVGVRITVAVHSERLSHSSLKAGITLE